MAKIPAITPLIQSEFAQSEHQKDKDIYRAIQTIEQSLNAINRDIASAIASASATIIGGTAAVKTFTLTANLVMAAPTEAVGQLIIYVFIQDATGGWTVTWPNPPFKGMEQPDPAPNFISVALAVKISATVVAPASFQAGGIDPT